MTAPVRVAEPLLSLLAVALVVFFPGNAFWAYFCLQTCTGPPPENVWAHRVGVALLVLAVAGTIVLAVRRRARWAFVWHGLVALAGLVSAAVFAVPQVDWRALLDEPAPEPDRHYVPCHSGPPDDCPGG